jgi:hypothetical protein
MFTKQHLQQAGFVGFRPLLSDLGMRIPDEPGTYVVLWGGTHRPKVHGDSTGGRFKGKDPHVPIHVAEAKLIPQTPTLYIGRTENCRKRIALLARFGRGEPVGHWGGRYLWQLAGPEHLVVAWRTERDPVAAEADLLDEFEAHFGALPYANLVRGRRQLATA